MKPPVRLKLRLPGGYFGFAYQWLPKMSHYQDRLKISDRLGVEIATLEAIWCQLPGCTQCKAIGMLAAAINQRIELQSELKDQRRRFIPFPVNRINEPTA